MELKEIILEEFKEEMETTRKFFELVFEEFYDYTPHEKSMNLLNIINHMVPISSWIPKITQQNELDWDKEIAPTSLKVKKDILERFDENVIIAKKALLQTNNAELLDDWTMRNKDVILFKGTKQKAIRRYVLNHIIHHRAQLGVYLRVTNDIVPGCYVKSADEILF